MNLNKDEIQVLKSLVEKEIKEFSSEEKTIRDVRPSFIASEEKYEGFLNSLLRKLK